MVRLADGSWRTMEESRRLFPNFDETRAWRLPDAPAALPGENLGEYLRRIGFSDETLHYVKRSYANAVGDDMRYIGADFFLEDVRDTSAGEGDYRILDGYDSLIHVLARGLDIRLSTIVKAIDWHGDGVRVTTAEGQIFAADRVLITLPLGVLQSGGVKFTPALPVEKQSAIDCLRMGPAVKMVYRFAQRILPEGISAVYSPHNPPMWWSPSFGHDYEGQVMTAFATGDWARELLALGEEGALQRGLAALRTELGRDDLQPDDMHLVNWPADPFALGGYSVTPPGAINARAQLAQPVENRLFWAGEATAPNVWAATVHGAYASGRRAASEVLQIVREREV
jgi:monoamine oxidase